MQCGSSSDLSNVLIGRDAEEACRRAAQVFIDAAHESIASCGRFTVSLSGGSTPKRLYSLLAQPEWASRVDWTKVHIFWGDERVVPPDDEKSNYRMTREALLSKINIPAENVHRVMTETGTPEEAAAAYEAEVRNVLAPKPTDVARFDLVLLGLGSNGHTASLFPYQPTLHVNDKLVVADMVREVGMYRISMTAKLLNDAAVAMFLVTGNEKADVLHEVLKGKHDPEKLPAQLIQPVCGMLLWVVDEAAAAKLHH